VFAVRVSPGGPTAAPDAPPASDNAPATPNTVTAFVRPFRFEFRLPCDMVETSHFAPLNVQLYNKLAFAGPRKWLYISITGDGPTICISALSLDSH
jgi:hypothetical protein